jgi:hypothetical protein
MPPSPLNLIQLQLICMTELDANLFTGLTSAPIFLSLTVTLPNVLDVIDLVSRCLCVRN